MSDLSLVAMIGIVAIAIVAIVAIVHKQQFSGRVNKGRVEIETKPQPGKPKAIN